MVQGYWSGATRKYFHPFRYAFVMVTISTILTLYSGTYDKQMNEMTVMQEQEEGSFFQPVNPDLTDEQQAAQLEFNNQVSDFVRNYLNLISLFFIPLGGLAVWLTFVDKKKYYREHIISACYYIGQTSLIGIPLIFLSLMNLINPIRNSLISISLSLIYGVWMLKPIRQVGLGQWCPCQSLLF